MYVCAIVPTLRKCVLWKRYGIYLLYVYGRLFVASLTDNVLCCITNQQFLNDLPAIIVKINADLLYILTALTSASFSISSFIKLSGPENKY